VNVADLSKLPYERDIRIPAKGETKLTVFIGSVPYKDPIVYKYFDYYVPTPSPSDQPGDTPEGEPGLPDAPVEP
jgi:hypothetical protein